MFGCRGAAAKHYRSRWENLECCQSRFQPIKFVNSVLPSPCETAINKDKYPLRRRPQKNPAEAVEVKKIPAS